MLLRSNSDMPQSHPHQITNTHSHNYKSENPNPKIHEHSSTPINPTHTTSSHASALKKKDTLLPLALPVS
jgi:hypothetical protein